MHYLPVPEQPRIPPVIQHIFRPRLEIEPRSMPRARREGILAELADACELRGF